jgi:hypothetical protein
MNSQPTQTTPDSIPLWLPAATAAAVHVLIVTAAWLAFGDDMLQAHDGQHFGALALDPLLLNSPTLDYVAYRASRIAMPALAWPFSWLGAVAALAMVQVGAVWIGVRALTNLAMRRELSPWFGFVFAILPGTLISTRVLVADAVAAAFMLAAADAWERGKVGWAWATLAVLSKETMLLAVAGFAVFDWRRAMAPGLALTVWVASLIARFGWDAPGETVGLPFVGAVEAVRVWMFNERWEEFAGGLGVILVVVVVGRLAFVLKSSLSIAALAVCLVIPFLGVAALQYAVHSQRLVLFPLASALVLLPNKGYSLPRTEHSLSLTSVSPGRQEPEPKSR